MDRRNLISAAVSAAILVPMAGAEAATTAFSQSIGGPDAAILSAWRRRVEAHGVLNSDKLDGGQDAAAPFWAVVDECDKLIHSSIAKTPRGVEVQIWTALHNSSAYVRTAEEAILRMDIDYVAANAGDFDWDAQPMIAAIRSLRALHV